MMKIYKTLKEIALTLLLFMVGNVVIGQTTSQLAGGIIINEIIADPNGANNFDTDGNGSFDSDDEYVELHNLSASSIDITGWEIWDRTSSLRHTFGTAVIPAGGYAVVIAGVSAGGSLANISGDVVEEASAGFLSFNNGGDVVLIYDPTNDQHIAVGYNGQTSINTNFIAAHPTSTLVNVVETTTDSDGLSMSRDTDGSTTFVNQGPTPGLTNTAILVTISADLSSGTEAATTVITLTAIANQNVTGAQTVDIAVTGTGITATDYMLSNTQISIADGMAMGSVTFTVQDDGDIEVTETATVTMSNPSGGVVLAPATSLNIDIIDDDTPLVVLTIVETLTDFGSTDNGMTSTSQNFTVAGTGLTADITVTAPASFEVSLDDVAFSTSVILTQAGGVVATTTVHTRFAPTTGLNGVKSGDITVSTAGATGEVVAVSGTETGNGPAVIEGFDTCVDLNSWMQQSVIGAQVWGCTTFGNNGDGAQVSGFSGGAQDNQDWLISPSLDLTASSALTFWSRTRFSGLTMEVKVSSDYTGSGDPTVATWTDLSVTLPAIDSDVWTETADVDLSSFAGSGVYIAYVYYSNPTDGAARWTLDDVVLTNTTTTTTPPSLTVTGTLTDFGSVDNGMTSSSQNFTVSGADLTDDITVTAPASFEVSLDDVAFSASVILTQAGGVVATTTVHARFAPASGTNGVKSGNITVGTPGTSNEMVAASGTETGNAALGIDLFFSEYIEPDGGNDKVIEIYNGTGGDVDLSAYMVRQSRNGAGFGNDGDSYDLPLTGTLVDGDVYVIYNSGATNGVILAEGDLALTHGVANGGTVTSFNGNDALGLFKSGVLIDLIGDPDSDPGSGWDVAGVTSATQNRTLVRKETITQGNPVALGSFGTDEPTSEWYVLDANIFINLGSFGAPVATPVLAVTASLTDFASVDNGMTSASQNFTVGGSDLLYDITVTAPTSFEVSLDDTAFSSSVILTPSGGVVATTTVYVRFAPTSGANGAKAGDVTVSTLGAAADEVIAVSGTESGNGAAVTESFDACMDLNSWMEESVIGAEVWECTTSGNNGDGVQASGFAGGGAQDNEDWLISPSLDLTASSALTFWSRTRFSGLMMEVKVSSDYVGSGDPTGATWTDLSVTLPALESDVWTETADVDLSSFAGSGVHIAYVYYSNPADGAARWTLDDVVITNSTITTVTPGFTLNTTSFVGDFGSVASDEVSTPSSYTVSGNTITGDFTVTIPVGFEASLTSDFTNQVGDNSQPLSFTPAGGEIDNVTIYVRFAPSAAGSFSGDLVNAATGYTSVNLAVTGAGTEEVTGLEELDKYNISIYPNPANDVLNISIPASFGAGEIKLVKLDGAIVRSGAIGSIDRIQTSDLRSGIYLLQIISSSTVINHRVVVE